MVDREGDPLSPADHREWDRGAALEAYDKFATVEDHIRDRGLRRNEDGSIVETGGPARIDEVLQRGGIDGNDWHEAQRRREAIAARIQTDLLMTLNEIGAIDNHALVEALDHGGLLSPGVRDSYSGERIADDDTVASEVWKEHVDRNAGEYQAGDDQAREREEAAEKGREAVTSLGSVHGPIHEVTPAEARKWDREHPGEARRAADPATWNYRRAKAEPPTVAHGENDFIQQGVPSDSGESLGEIIENANP
jgi:hypothetical protein